MRILCVANWSEGRDRATLSDIRWALRSKHAVVHYDGADFDHNRIVTAFSGEEQIVRSTLLHVANVAFDRIDMRRHQGVHPRIGALDVCPFVQLDDTPLSQVLAWASDLAYLLSARFGLPIFLYEKSETGRHAKDLPTLRKGQFEGLVNKTLQPDFGPSRAHPWLGVTVLGVRDWLLAANLNLADQCPEIAKQIAKQLRSLRETDPRFKGVRALGFPLPSRNLSQVSLNLTDPDSTPFDPIAEWVHGRAISLGTKVVSTELVGVIHERHLKTATNLQPTPNQIIAT